MRKFLTGKNKLKPLAWILVIVMVFNALQTPITSVYAATEETEETIPEETETVESEKTETTETTEETDEEEMTVSFSANENLVYTGEEQELVTLSMPDGCAAEFMVNNGEWTNCLPTATEAGSYSIEVSVLKEDEVIYSGHAETVINKATIDGLLVTAYQGTYDGEEHPLFEINGDNYDTYVISGEIAGEEGTTEIPNISLAGSYEFSVTFSKENYEDLTISGTAVIDTADITGYEISYRSGLTYNTEAQQLVDEVEAKEGDLVQYSVKFNDGEYSAYSSEVPTGTEAGSYYVRILVTRDDKNYHDTCIENTEAYVEINKSAQEIDFTNADLQKAYTYEGSSYTIDFSAASDTQSDTRTISYSLVNLDYEEDDIDDSVASISEDGIVTVNKGGYILGVEATVAGDSNYEEASTYYVFYVLDNVKGLVSFKNATSDYLLGSSDTAANQTADKAWDDNGKIKYSASVLNDNINTLSEAGLKFDSSTGVLSLKNIETLSQILAENDGSIEVEITADKGVGTKQAKLFGFIPLWDEYEVYAADSASYTVTIKTEATPENAYTLLSPESVVMTAPNGNNGWFNTAVTVCPLDGYMIAKNVSDEFASNVVFEDQGITDRYVYLKSKTTGGITAAILVDIEKVDTVAPAASAITVEYSKAVNTIVDKLKSLFYRYYSAPVEVTISGFDETSGIENFTWTYERNSYASATNVETLSGTVSAVQSEDDGTMYSVTFTLPEDVGNEIKQLNGSLKVYATDYAGNVSNTKISKYDDDVDIIVVDSISPTKIVTHTEGIEVTKGEDLTSYYAGDVNFTFDVTETNFYSEDVYIYVTKDNYSGEVEKYRVEPEWSLVDEATDTYEAKITLSGDADYVVTASYTDRSGNEMESYTSEKIVIDTIAPEVNFEYLDYATSMDETGYEPQSIVLTVKEHNFDAAKFNIKTVAKDITGKDVSASDIITNYFTDNDNWVKDTTKTDTYVATISTALPDALYTMVINLADISGNKAETVNVDDTFTVDRTAPEISTVVTYSQPVSSAIIDAITFGYYQTYVDMTFTAKDMTSGVKGFDWNYNKEEGASSINLGHDYGFVEAVQDEEDKTKFSATITLPKSVADQLRGNITVSATDNCANTSDIYADNGNVFVRDNISPSMTVDYTAPINTQKGKEYYSSDVTYTFTIKEANFYKDDVKVNLQRGGQAQALDLDWKEQAEDVYVASHTISAAGNDNDYVFSVEYTDRSGNVMTSYTSSVIVIDTTLPVIDVKYNNTDIKNELTDSEGNLRKYYNEVQTATISITEHNFDEDAVIYDVVAKDVNGNEVNNNEFQKSGWAESGDVHTMTLTYDKDANYTFSMECTDLAKNKSNPYQKDYFTVDKTKPADLGVTYSTSVLETTLENLTFGFYKAKATVTITAKDTTSGVYNFKYSYTKEPGVSDINAELLDQLIEEANITYSDGKATATASFEVPKDLLDANNQFNGNISFTATDKGANESEVFADGKRIVVDNIAPTATITYNAPVQELDGVSYYDGSITATIVINEANFYSNDVVIGVTKDGATYNTNVTWTNDSEDVHTGSFTLSEDGDYFITASYTDKSTNQMQSYTSNQLTIDTVMEDASIQINGGDPEGQAYKDDISLNLSFEDTNFEAYELSILRTNYGNKNVDVTNEFVGSSLVTNATGVSASVNSFDKIKENDGIYTLTFAVTDKAGHRQEYVKNFTANRFGSVYEYSDYLVSLISDGGEYIQKVNENLVVTEYNADKLVEESLVIEISKDGRPLDEVKYTVSPEISEATSVGESGWYQYQYTISKDNFAGDGVYKISISSKDATGNSPENTPENTNYENNAIIFRVDSTAPEINSITGLEKNIINATEVKVGYTVYDTIGLAGIDVYVNESLVVDIDDFTADGNNYESSFNLEESNKAQTVRMVVTDLAGNVTDTSSESYTSAFAFNDQVTISTNAFVRLWANKILFWSSTAAVVIAIPSAVSGVMLLKRKKGTKLKAEAK